MWAQCFFDQRCLLEKHKTTAASSWFHSNFTLSNDFQNKNREQSIVFILTERSQKLHYHQQACFLLQLWISANCKYSKPAKTVVEASVPTVKDIFPPALHQKTGIYFIRPVCNVSRRAINMMVHSSDILAFFWKSMRMLSVLVVQVLMNSHFCNAANHQHFTICTTFMQSSLHCGKLALL